MRRTDKEIKDDLLIERIMSEAQVLRLGLCRDNRPYVVPLSFGYDGGFIYFHTAVEGRKLDYIAANNRVCFELEHEVKVSPKDDAACGWSFSFYSVVGFGTVEEITDPPGKTRALNHVMKHYSGREWDFNEESLEKTRLWKISVEQMTGKRSKDKITD